MDGPRWIDGTIQVGQWLRPRYRPLIGRLSARAFVPVRHKKQRRSLLVTPWSSACAGHTSSGASVHPLQYNRSQAMCNGTDALRIFSGSIGDGKSSDSPIRERPGEPPRIPSGRFEESTLTARRSISLFPCREASLALCSDTWLLDSTRTSFTYR